MVSHWRLDADSPLLPYAAEESAQVRFSVGHDLLGTDGLPQVDQLLAGAAEVDITPPPGLPKAGYSRNAHTGTGFRTRLRARILHLRAGTSSIALVQCDLLGGSAVLQRLVARTIAETTDIPLAGLMVGATHTHGGPGQFLGTGFYNRYASNKPGFDGAWTQWLCERIAGGVEQAFQTRRPAKLATGTTEVWGLTRNRSLRPHVRNQDLDDHRDEPQRTYANINPDLHLIRVDGAASDGGFEPMAAAVVFSVHGTGVPMRSPTYNADLWAYLTDELTRQVVRSTGVRPVVGAMEGTHADVAPALHPGQAGHLEAERIGRAVGDHAAQLYDQLESQLSSQVDLSCGLREIDLERSPSLDGHRLPRRPAVGAALVAGAYENETPVIHRIPPFRAGTPRRTPRGPHGVKRVLGGPFQRLTLPLRDFPRVLPIQVLRIGTTALVGLPFEITVATGRRVAKAVQDHAGPGNLDRVVVSSVANEYSGYCATPEEYGLQHYEGAHTLYGPETQPFLAAHAGALAAETLRAPVVTDVLSQRAFSLRHRRYLPERAGRRQGRDPAGRPSFADATATTDPSWEQRWYDGGPGDLDWHECLVRVEAAEHDGDWRPVILPGGQLLDDTSCDLEVVQVPEHNSDGRATYAVRWHRPQFHRQRRHRFVLLANAGQRGLPLPPFS